MRERLPWLCAVLSVLVIAEAKVKCFDCVGKDCMENFCHGDYCVLSHYAPRWGSSEWGKGQIVKGCMSGSLLRKDIRDHCEAADYDSEPFTCFCKNKDLCNSGQAQRRLEIEQVDLLNCMCDHQHCDGKTCLGEMCSYVINHRTKAVERGCVNASVPLVERRSMGSCMAPPITGAMHHSDAADLLVTESCVCGADYCNSEKPEPEVDDNQKCQTHVSATVMGTPMKSRNSSCQGEYCFKASIVSKIGDMAEYHTSGCASFTGDDKLAEELNPVGCAVFTSEQLEVTACFKTKDANAIGRARANQQVAAPKKQKGRAGSRKPQPKIEVEEIDEFDEDEEEEEPEPPKKQQKQPKKETAKAKEVEKEKEAEEEEEEEKVEEEEKKEEAEETSSPKNFIFEKPTQAPIPDDSNTTMIAVFLLIMLCIVVSGVVWKLELHKRLFRANYDSVAGG